MGGLVFVLHKLRDGTAVIFYQSIPWRVMESR